MDVTIRPMDHRVLAIVAKAQAEHFTMDPCPACGGPRIYSKLIPRAKCFGCGAVTALAMVRPAERRLHCDRCHKVFYAKVAWKFCDACKRLAKRRKAIEAKWDGSKRAQTEPETP